MLFSGEQKPEFFLSVFLWHSLLEVDATVSFWQKTWKRELFSSELQKIAYEALLVVTG